MSERASMGNSKRFLPYRKKKPIAKLNRDQISEAIRKFQNSGGLIEKLPPEQVNRRRVVGNRWGSMYEVIFDQL